MTRRHITSDAEFMEYIKTLKTKQTAWINEKKEKGVIKDVRKYRGRRVVIPRI